MMIFLACLSTRGHASECRSLFDAGDYDAAIPICLKEDRNFELGYIYGYKQNCNLMRRYYLKSGNAIALGNLGMNLLSGTRGCEKKIDEGIKYLNQAIDAGRAGYADILGDYYSKIGATKRAKFYYLQSVKSPASTEWWNNRIDESFEELMTILTFDEKTELLSTHDLNKEKKCELGRILINAHFTKIIEKYGYQSAGNTFINSLCNGDKEYFLGLTFENGFGNKEDFREAYRYYLLAGAAGSKMAKNARDRIRDKLSTEQIAAATCIADYGLKPNMFNQWRCGW